MLKQFVELGLENFQKQISGYSIESGKILNGKELKKFAKIEILLSRNILIY